MGESDRAANLSEVFPPTMNDSDGAANCSEGLMEASHKAGIAGTLGLLFVLLCAFTTFLLLHGKNRQHTSNKLAASIMIGHAIFTILEDIMLIHTTGLSGQVVKPYCWFHGYAVFAYYFFVPTSLLVLIVDVFIYIRDPAGYAQKISKIGVIAMVAFPWVFSLLLALVVVITCYGDVEVERILDNGEVEYVCLLSQEKNIIGMYLQQGLILVVGVTSLVSLIVVTVIRCCVNKPGTDLSLMGEEVGKAVKFAVIALCFLCVGFILFLFCKLATLDQLYKSAKVHYVMVYGLLQAVLFICLFKGTRDVVPEICCGKGTSGGAACSTSSYDDNKEEEAIIANV